MDPLSLLAEIYGNGRETVRLLHDQGLYTLEDISIQKPRGLSRMLRISQREAKKILVEAQDMLQGRLFEPHMRLVQPPMGAQRDLTSHAAQETSEPSPEPSQPQSHDIKTRIVDLVAKRFP